MLSPSPRDVEAVDDQQRGRHVAIMADARGRAHCGWHGPTPLRIAGFSARGRGGTLRRLGHVEGSTKLLRELGAEYVRALSEHRSVIRKAVARNRGVEVDTQGDAFLNSNPVGRMLVADLTEEESTGAREVLAGMLRERSGGNGGVFNVDINIGIGTK